jgi:hypothetical protein
MRALRFLDMTARQYLTAQFAAAAVMLLLIPRGAGAQVPKYELGAGYVHVVMDTSADVQQLDGVTVSFARNLNGWFGVVADLGGYHLEGFRLGTYLFGPRLTARAGERVSIFGQALIGGAHANAGGRGFPAYHDSLASAAGFGFDYRAGRRIAIRLVHSEYLQTRLGNDVQHNLRIGAGIVLRFGIL